MFVSHDKRVVYVRVPKTGSTAVVRQVHATHRGTSNGWDLEPYDVGFHTHVMVSQMPLEFKVRYKDYTWVGAIRNPYTWIPSFHAWIQKNTEYVRTTFLSHPEVEGNWVKFLDQLTVTPASWLYDPDGVVQVKSYKQEDPRPIEKLLGIKLADQMNVSKKKRDFVPDMQLKAIVHRKFFRELPYYTEPSMGETNTDPKP